jgi:hypothetical protein
MVFIGNPAFGTAAMNYFAGLGGHMYVLSTPASMQTPAGQLLIRTCTYMRPTT